MKNLLALVYSFAIGATAFAFAEKNVSEKVLQLFKQSFPNAEQVVWKEYPETYVVNFLEDGIRSSVIYEKDGTFKTSTRYYQQQNLPYYLLYNIKKRYPDKKIFGVTEISTIMEIQYYIKLEDASVWTTIKMDCEGNLQVVEKVKKESQE